MNLRSRLAPLLLAPLLACSSLTSFAGDWVYHFKAGDTLWDLCLKYTHKRGCWIELAKYNDVSRDRAIPVGSEIRIPAQWLINPPTVGSVSAVTGVVKYYLNPAAPAEPLRPGQGLHLGARLVSGEGSARLTLGAGNEVLLRPHSVLELNTMSGSASERSTAELGLPSGAVEVKVAPNRKSRFSITTPAAIAAVRGTEYRVSSLGADGASMRSEVLAGAVNVAAGKAGTTVPAGFGVAAAKGTPPSEPRKLLPAPQFKRSYAAVSLPVKIKWTDDQRAESWLLDLLEEEESGALLASHASAEPSYTFASLVEGCYRLQLRAIDRDGFNGLESSAPLCIVPRPAATAQLSPITPTANGDMELQWANVAGAERYRVEIGSDNSFNQVITTHLTTDTSIRFKPPAASFSSRVITIDAAGNESAASAHRDYQPPQEIPWQVKAMTVLMLLLAL